MRSLNDKQVEEVKKALKNKSAYAVAKELGLHIRIVTEIKNGTYVNTVEPKKLGTAKTHDPAKKQQRRFDAKQVREIRELLQKKTTVAAICRQFKVNKQTIIDIRDGYSYRDVK